MPWHMAIPIVADGPAVGETGVRVAGEVNLALRYKGLGGPGRVRTDDLFHAMEARSQLRHRPTAVGQDNSRPRRIDSQTDEER